MTTDPTAAIEVWARMLCAADVHVHGDDHPTWQQLVGEPGQRIRDDYRKAARWLLPRLTVQAAPAAAGVAPAAGQTPECSASVSGNCLREQQSETACDTQDGECVHGGKPAADQTLRDRIADAVKGVRVWRTIDGCDGWEYAGTEALADAVLAVLGDQRAAIRAEAFRDAADLAERLMDERYGPDCSYAIGGLDVARELRRVAAGAREWCKCRSCWGWFVEEHPGEDLDELGRDLSWWSGLPEHRDAPAGAQQQTAPVAQQPAADGEEETWFGMPGCTCRAFTRQDGPPRYLEPHETVDKVSGWEPGADCPHHTPRP